LVEVAIEGGLDNGAGADKRDALAGAVRTAGPAGADQPNIGWRFL